MRARAVLVCAMWVCGCSGSVAAIGDGVPTREAGEDAPSDPEAAPTPEAGQDAPVVAPEAGQDAPAEAVAPDGGPDVVAVDVVGDEPLALDSGSPPQDAGPPEASPLPVRCKISATQCPYNGGVYQGLTFCGCNGYVASGPNDGGAVPGCSTVQPFLISWLAADGGQGSACPTSNEATTGVCPSGDWCSVLFDPQQSPACWGTCL